MPFRFSTTPFLNTRQFYYGLETGAVDPGFDLALEHNHSPAKDQKLLCGELDATAMSMGKYVTAKLVSHTATVPVDPLAVAAGLTYREGNGLFVAADADIDAPSDLVGERVGIHDATLAMTYHRAVLEERFGVAPADVEWVVDTHQGLADRMRRGDLAAVERINDWYWAWREGDDYRMLYDVAQEWHAVFDYYPLVHLVAVDRAVADENPYRVTAFVDALQHSRTYCDENHDAILQAFVDDPGGEWTGDRTVDALRPVTDGVECPFVLEDAQRQNVRDWMAYADRYGVFESVPIADDRLFPQ